MSVSKTDRTTVASIYFKVFRTFQHKSDFSCNTKTCFSSPSSAKPFIAASSSSATVVNCSTRLSAESSSMDNLNIFCVSFLIFYFYIYYTIIFFIFQTCAAEVFAKVSLSDTAATTKKRLKLFSCFSLSLSMNICSIVNSSSVFAIALTDTSVL